MMEGTAAIRSTMETRRPRTLAGAYSLMNSAVARASGNAKNIATQATAKVPTSTEAMPTTSLSGDHCWVVKNDQP